MSVGDIAMITAPTLVMVGDDDSPSRSHLRVVRDAASRATVRHTGWSHALPIERPGEVARLVVELLTAELPPTTLMPVRRATAAALIDRHQ